MWLIAVFLFLIIWLQWSLQDVCHTWAGFHCPAQRLLPMYKLLQPIGYYLYLQDRRLWLTCLTEKGMKNGTPLSPNYSLWIFRKLNKLLTSCLIWKQSRFQTHLYVAATSPLKVFFISQFSPLSEHLHFSGINMSILTSIFLPHSFLFYACLGLLRMCILPCCVWLPRKLISKDRIHNMIWFGINRPSPIYIHTSKIVL